MNVAKHLHSDDGIILGIVRGDRDHIPDTTLNASIYRTARLGLR